MNLANMSITEIFNFLMNSFLIAMAVLAGIGLVLIWRFIKIYEVYLQNKKSKEQDKESDTE